MTSAALHAGRALAGAPRDATRASIRAPLRRVSIHEATDGAWTVIVGGRRAGVGLPTSAALDAVSDFIACWPAPRTGRAFWPSVFPRERIMPAPKHAGGLRAYRLLSHADGALGGEILDLTRGSAARALTVGGSGTRFTAREAVAVLRALTAPPTPSSAKLPTLPQPLPLGSGAVGGGDRP
jgi:hypothetical protein